jgi:hypothetical protein
LAYRTQRNENATTSSRKRAEKIRPGVSKKDPEKETAESMKKMSARNIR